MAETPGFHDHFSGVWHAGILKLWNVTGGHAFQQQSERGQVTALLAELATGAKAEAGARLVRRNVLVGAHPYAEVQTKGNAGVVVHRPAAAYGRHKGHARSRVRKASASS